MTQMIHIFKYELPFAVGLEFGIRENCTEIIPLKFDIQNDKLVLWVHIHDFNRFPDRSVTEKFILFFTGDEVIDVATYGDMAYYDYIGTTQLKGLVYHLYQRKNAEHIG